MEAYKLIWLKDAHARPVQLSIPKFWVRRAAIAAGVAALVVGRWASTTSGCVATRPSSRTCAVEAGAQREQIAAFRSRIQEVDTQLSKVADLERKVRIIANLPGAVGVGGEQSIEEEAIPVGAERTHPALRRSRNRRCRWTRRTRGRAATTRKSFRRVWRAHEEGEWLGTLDERATHLGADAEERVESLAHLLDQLEDKQDKLASSPSVWPSKGWLTSRFGARISPFTGRRQMHAGLDIAAASGTPIVAPARGRATFVGTKGPLGRALVIDHGFGVKTMYGHTRDIFVKPGRDGRTGPADRQHREHRPQYRSPSPLRRRSERRSPQSPRLHLRLIGSSPIYPDRSGPLGCACSRGLRPRAIAARGRVSYPPARSKTPKTFDSASSLRPLRKDCVETA